MLDIKFIRENLDLIKSGAKKKHMEVDLDALLVLDDKRKELITAIETKKAEQNAVSKEVANTEDNEIRAQKISEMKTLKDEIHKEDEELKRVMKEWKEVMLQVPNIPDMSVPDGKDDEDNQEIKTWGEKPKFDFEPKDHIDIMTALNMVDFERGAKVHGFRGYYLQNDGAQLAWAVWNYAQQFFMEKGFQPMIAPAIARKENFYGTGFLPKEAEDLYHTQDGDYLSGTSEVPVMGYYADDVLSEKDFPIRWLAFSPCYRREAGSHGRDVKGLIRVHEFYKLEQVLLCEASHEKSVEWHEWLNRNTEEFIESLNIPYHTVVNCGGDLGQGQVKKYDIELWVPMEEKYREISSASYFHDFQTRRFNIRYKDSEGKLQYAHSLNCTAIPTPRILVSLVENFQQEDGSIKVPEVLQKYLGKEVIK